MPAHGLMGRRDMAEAEVLSPALKKPVQSIP
jgi:hypothetical protein